MGKHNQINTLTQKEEGILINSNLNTLREFLIRFDLVVPEAPTMKNIFEIEMHSNIPKYFESELRRNLERLKFFDYKLTFIRSTPWC